LHNEALSDNEDNDANDANDANDENDVNDAEDEVVDGPTVLAHVDLARTICEFTIYLIFS
jgi:hypothetical protein